MINSKFVLILFFTLSITLKSQEYFDRKLIPFKELIVNKLDINQEFLNISEDSVKYNMVYSRLIFKKKDLTIYEISTLKSHNLRYIFIIKKHKILLFDKLNSYEVFKELIPIISNEKNCCDKGLINWVLISIEYNRNLFKSIKSNI